MPQVMGREVGPIGYGLMGFTWCPDPTPTDQAIEALKEALESGLTLWNGAEFYGTPECNSMTLIKAYFTRYPEDADRVTLVIKGGMDLTTHKQDSSPEGTRRSLNNILKQLGGTKKLDGYAPSRRDASTPLEVTYGVIQSEYIDTGKLGAVYLSECSAATINEAAKLTNIAAAEVELSMFSPDILTNGVAEACAQHKIPILAYSPIGRGILTGKFKSVADMRDRGLISSYPRFQPGAFEHNLKMVSQVEEIAKAKGCTPGQLAIAWVRKHSNRPGLPTVIPIPGATAASRVRENAKLVDITESDFTKMSDIVRNFETAGKRYPDSIPCDT
ncbi:Aldo/keto reductase [Metarhizium rileyi]|uniref:Aldo/keto reductase n=1 Tax=Metarhizium rileyi (strain RCEF 4871) TaxID=1649241 RepID=A0A162JD60_METRR|nr:Aldo/keto reductase [Metarhizium rileyi RCEF 4871]TWU77105.1 Pyridoxine 4-dehydrogenase [Metarhizium rileyi]